MARLDTYLEKLHELGGSDLHMSTGVPAKVRVHGKLSAISKEPLEKEALAGLIDEILTERSRKIYAERNDVDFAYEIEGMARFRVSAFVTRTGPGIVFRYIPQEILPLEKLRVPDVILRYTKLNSGLVLVTGPTGSGKSTTLASLFDYINTNQKKHIITMVFSKS